MRSWPLLRLIPEETSFTESLEESTKPAGGDWIDEFWLAPAGLVVHVRANPEATSDGTSKNSGNPVLTRFPAIGTGIDPIKDPLGGGVG